MLEALALLHRERFITDLDLHFARLMARLDGTARAEVAWAAMIAIRAVSQGHACVDLERVAARPLCECEAAPLAPALGPWLEALRASPIVGAPGDFRPLILNERHRLYLYRYWSYEQSVATALRKRAADAIPVIELGAMPEILARLFPEGDAEEPQRLAAEVAARRRLCVVTGGPGAGKTTAVVRMLALLIEIGGTHAPLRIALTAPTGKAAARLQEAVRTAKGSLAFAPERLAAIPTEATTLHRLLGARRGSTGFLHHRDHPLPVDALVVDEASMVDLDLMARLLEALPDAARLILLGDKDQLAAVGPGAVFGEICGTATSDSAAAKAAASSAVVGEAGSLRGSIVVFRRSFRFSPEGGIGSLARAVLHGQAEEALSILRREHSDLSWRELGDPNEPIAAPADRLVDGYRDALVRAQAGGEAGAALAAFNRFRVLCVHRRGPAGAESLNGRIAWLLRRAGLIPGRAEWYPGRPVIITDNHYDLGLFNGDIGIALGEPGSAVGLRVYFEGKDGALRGLAPARLPAHETVFALTVHKSQGSEFEQVLLVLPEADSPLLSRELFYTAITRAGRHLEIWGSAAAIRKAIRQRADRASGLREALWAAA